jgi:DNA-binding HxlR family transcriptional regulator
VLVKGSVLSWTRVTPAEARVDETSARIRPCKRPRRRGRVGRTTPRTARWHLPERAGIVPAPGSSASVCARPAPPTSFPIGAAASRPAGAPTARPAVLPTPPARAGRPPAAPSTTHYTPGLSLVNNRRTSHPRQTKAAPDAGVGTRRVPRSPGGSPDRPGRRATGRALRGIAGVRAGDAAPRSGRHHPMLDGAHGNGNVRQWCPVSHASAILGDRSTPLIVRGLLAGVQRRLLAQRLQRLQRAGAVRPRVSTRGRTVASAPTPAGAEPRRGADGGNVPPDLVRPPPAGARPPRRRGDGRGP